MHTTQTTTGLTFEQLRLQVERVRLRRLPPRTLQHWLQHLPISRDADGLYSLEDKEIICDLVRWLRRPGNTIEQFVNRVIEEYCNAN